MSGSAQVEWGSRVADGPLALTVADAGSARLLRVEGDLDLATVRQLTAMLERLDFDPITLLVLDLEELDFLDLAGLRTILQADDDCRRDQVRLTVIRPRGFASRVFTLTRAHHELEVVDPPARGWSGRAN